MTFRPAGAARGRPGRDGHEGRDGVNVIPADNFIASRIGDEDSATRTALDARYSAGAGGQKAYALAVGEPVPDDIGHRDIIVRFNP